MNIRQFGKRLAPPPAPALPEGLPTRAPEVIFLDEFTREIEETRSNEYLTELLRKRAEDPATVSLQEVKRRFGLR